MPGDVERNGELMSLLGDAVAAARARRRYRLGLALIVLIVVTPFVVLGVVLLVSG